MSMQTKELQIYKLSKFSVAGIRTRVAQRAAIHYIKSWKTQPWIQKVQNFFSPANFEMPSDKNLLTILLQEALTHLWLEKYRSRQ